MCSTGCASHASPSPSPSASACDGLYASGQLSAPHRPSPSWSWTASCGQGSQASPAPSWSESCCAGLNAAGQLSRAKHTPSPSLAACSSEYRNPRQASDSARSPGGSERCSWISPPHQTIGDTCTAPAPAEMPWWLPKRISVGAVLSAAHTPSSRVISSSGSPATLTVMRTPAPSAASVADTSNADPRCQYAVAEVSHPAVCRSRTTRARRREVAGSAASASSSM